MAESPVPPRKKVKEETLLVLEAFLQRALSTEDKEPPGHVGRGYHDPQSFMHSTCSTSEEHAAQCPGWTHVHEEINRVEEKKHGFRSSVKRLLQRRSSPRRSPDKQPSSKDSLKRSKAEGEVGEKNRLKRSFSLKNFLRKKGTPSFEGPCPHGPPQRPDSLPIVTCYCRRKPAERQELRTNENGAEGTELYTLAAEKLEHLVKKQQLTSPSVAKNRSSPIEQLSTIPSVPVNSGELPRELDEAQKEEILQKLIALLEEQAEDINKEIEANPLLRNTLNRLSYRSFSRLAEAFTSQSPTDVPSPQLAKLALTMELTRKVAGINSHTVHTLMGYSLQYMDMFIPWLQQQGGWENIVTQDEIFDLQLD